VEGGDRGDARQRARAKRAKWIPRIAAFIVVGGILLLAWAQAWPFDSDPQTIEHFDSPSVWQYLFSERYVLGYVRLALIFASLFVVASVTALAFAERWISGFGGLSVDEKERAEDHISGLEERLTATQGLLDEELRKRQEAEDWANELIDELDQTNIELEQAREELEASEQHGEDLGGDSGPAG
jgi:hypothetical protein